MLMLRCLQLMLEQYDDLGNLTLLRYIHQNPTKAGIVSKVGDYDWCSWKEYTGEVPGALGLCATNAILKRMSLDELKELVEAPLDDDVQCLDLDEDVKISVGDREIRQYLLDIYGIADSVKVQEMDKEKRKDARGQVSGICLN